MKSDSIHCFSRCRKKWLMFTLTKCQNRQASVATVTSVHLERRRKCDGVTGSTEAEGRGGKLAQVNAVTLHGLCSNTQMKLCSGCGHRIRTCQSQSQHASFVLQMTQQKQNLWTLILILASVWFFPLTFAAKVGRQKFFAAALAPVFCWVIHPDSRCSATKSSDKVIKSSVSCWQTVWIFNSLSPGTGNVLSRFCTGFTFLPCDIGWRAQVWFYIQTFSDHLQTKNMYIYIYK